MIRKVLSIAGYAIIIVGVIAGLYLWQQLTVTGEPVAGIRMNEPHTLRWLYVGGFIAVSVISGLLLVGFGENLRILQEIKDE